MCTDKIHENTQAPTLAVGMFALASVLLVLHSMRFIWGWWVEWVMAPVRINQTEQYMRNFRILCGFVDSFPDYKNHARAKYRKNNNSWPFIQTNQHASRALKEAAYEGLCGKLWQDWRDWTLWNFHVYIHRALACHTVKARYSLIKLNSVLSKTQGRQGKSAFRVSICTFVPLKQVLLYQ